MSLKEQISIIHCKEKLMKTHFEAASDHFTEREIYSVMNSLRRCGIKIPSPLEIEDYMEFLLALMEAGYDRGYIDAKESE